VRAGEARDIYGHDVLIAYAPVANRNLGWLVFVELPIARANRLAQ
jgi:hypothetical protein